MANGDDATTAGLDLVEDIADRRDGWDEINKTRDYIARLMLDASKIVGGVLSAARIPNLSASKITSGVMSTHRVQTDGGLDLQTWLETYGSASDLADGPTTAAYLRAATGSNWRAVWMNDNNQFMQNTSSKRYKTDIETMLAPQALADVCALRPVTYAARFAPDTGRHLGLIAEEVHEVYPEIVPLDPEGRPDAVNYEFLVAPLIAAVQELAQQNVELLKRVEHLEEPNA